MYSILIGFRRNSGADYASYELYYQYIHERPATLVLEPISQLILFLAPSATIAFFIFSLTTNMVFLLSIRVYNRRVKVNPTIATIFYILIVQCGLVQINLIRQSLATSVMILAGSYLFTGKKKKTLIVSLLAVLIHVPSIVMLMAQYLLIGNDKRKYVKFMILVVLIIFLGLWAFNNYELSVIQKYISYLENLEGNALPTRFLLEFIVIFIPSLIFVKNRQLLLMTAIGFLLILSVNVTSFLGARFSYYFFGYYPLYLASIGSLKNKAILPIAFMYTVVLFILILAFSITQNVYNINILQ